MNYLVKWQFTKNNSVHCKTQVEIIRENIIPLSEDPIFLANKFSFYSTKVYLTDVRIAVFVEESKLNAIQGVIARHTNGLILHSYDMTEGGDLVANDWDGSPQITTFTFSSKTTDVSEIFYIKYLEDITRIGIDIHRSDISPAVTFAMRMAAELQPIGSSVPRQSLDTYFRDTSSWYRSKNNQELESFWGDNGFAYRQGSTEGAHFYYNIVVGIDPRGRYQPSQFEGIATEINRAINS